MNLGHERLLAGRLKFLRPDSLPLMRQRMCSIGHLPDADRIAGLALGAKSLDVFMVHVPLHGDSN